MARLISSGFELNSVTTAVEWTAILTNAPTIQSAIVHPGGGTYALRCTQTSGGKTGVEMNYTALAGPMFFRFYFYFTGTLSATTTLIRVFTSSPATTATISMNTSNQLILNDSVGVIGSASSALNASQWYRVELNINTTPASGSRVVTALVDGVQFATKTTSTTNASPSIVDLGSNILNEASTGAIFYFDDFALNDATGSFQNTYPGAGSIMHVLPASNGDINTFATQTGGTSGSAFNYTRVNEVPPDDATTLNGSNTVNQEDLFRLQPVVLTGSVNVVQVGIRFRNNTADATTALKAEIIGVSGGTKTQSAAIVPNSTTFKTNATSVTVFPYPITAYQDPGSVNWTQNTLNTMQIGYIVSTGGSNRVEFTSAWALIEVTDSIKLLQPTTINNYQQVKVGDGMSVSEKIR